MKTTSKNQQGIVSLIVTLVLMIVITLIVLSFAKLSNREQRNALDQQLTTQAFYASESGINYAKDKIPAVLAAHPGVPSYNANCSSFTTVAGSPAVPNASVTCLLVDLAGPTIDFDKSPSQHVFPIQDEHTGLSITRVTLSWDSALAGGSFSNCSAWSLSANPTPAALPSNCDAGVIRLELLDASGGSISETNSRTFFIYPGNSDHPISFANATGTKTTGDCDTANTTPGKCKVTVILGGSHYYARLLPLYAPQQIHITNGVEAVTGSSVNFIGAQVTIDSTGKAGDVLRRTQVRTPISGIASDGPDYGLQADAICKQFTIAGVIAGVPVASNSCPIPNSPF